MFNKSKFNAMLSNHNCKKRDLAKALGLKEYSLYRRIRNGGTFTTNEVRQMMALFSREEVIDCLFYCE